MVQFMMYSVTYYLKLCKVISPYYTFYVLPKKGKKCCMDFTS